MVTKTIVIPNSGVTSRAIAMFVNKASEYNSHITISAEEKQANAKSLLGVLAIGLNESNQVEIDAEGKDEEEAVRELSTFLLAGSKF